MQITDNCMVSIHFQLTNDQGEMLDRSPDGQPLVYLHGVAGILPALERALTGQVAGDTFEVRITPEEGFGYPQPELVMQVPREAVPNASELTPGMQVHGRSDNDDRQFVVTALDDATITLDGNHPLAGITLCFSGTVLDVRAATEDEQANWLNGLEAQ